ncbi:hypothetical protein BKA62DRAFT_824474 [Auriculariales sp. MPI-PUGE-AT-0066]|nr:hypothetical protein BKA62DRAFT_824474 [Auriculariales sp. MPI-PUGE-AT-0066]
MALYLGVDPTARSMHVGHLLPFIVLLHFQANGHQPIALVGGATGTIGDPSFRSDGRENVPDQVRQQNVQALSEQINTLFRTAGPKAASLSDSTDATRHAKLLNNAEWHDSMTMLQFISSAGVVRVKQMLSRDSMQTRLNAPESLSFSELTYQLLQAYDFYHLNRHHRCEIQLGGADQWGNIVTGLDLIHRRRSLDLEPSGLESASNTAEAYALTTPLLTTPSGEKFGKSAGNAFFLRCPDDVSERYLKLFTFLPLAEITMVMKEHEKDPSARFAQRVLAAEVTELVHGKKAMEGAKAVTRVIYDPDAKSQHIDKMDVISALTGTPLLFHVSHDDVNGQVEVISLATKAKLVPSKTAARALVDAGGLYLNGERVANAKQHISHSDFNNGVMFLRAGKEKHVVVVQDGGGPNVL